MTRAIDSSPLRMFRQGRHHRNYRNIGNNCKRRTWLWMRRHRRWTPLTRPIRRSPSLPLWRRRAKTVASSFCPSSDGNKASVVSIYHEHGHPDLRTLYRRSNRTSYRKMVAVNGRQRRLKDGRLHRDIEPDSPRRRSDRVEAWRCSYGGNFDRRIYFSSMSWKIWAKRG